jgi:hypothetical protein
MGRWMVEPRVGRCSVLSRKNRGSRSFGGGMHPTVLYALSGNFGGREFLA